MSLAEDVQITKTDLDEFRDITHRILEYLPNVINEESDYRNYKLCSSNIAGTRKQIRPFNNDLFLREADKFGEHYDVFSNILENLKSNNRDFEDEDYQVIDKTIYTIQQALGIGLDLFVESNSARKHVGNRFEELIRVLLSEVNISLKKIVINIPYETDEGEKFYKCETDVVVSPFNEVRSNSQNIDQNELIISLKTTTKDRMPKIFIDKILLENFLQHPVRVVGISQNDIQRKGDDKISYTFVSNLFMVYTRFLIQLEGYYYLDRPSRAFESPFNQHIFPFSRFLLNDIWQLLRP
ncbi:MAG: hypothetical protein K9H48_20770 [Melioribacteraceae bacterium]|nr:hypothetical protein [Melioribacteraceae bacterium]MCF8393126.1 hypothetical protein [Melioribacteraceae bacterium]MCF8421240.1 hypothetical protein [Melioribacteraceae bacterium]